MAHLWAIGKGLLIFGLCAAIVGYTYLACVYPFILLPPLIIFFAWILGGGVEI